MFSIEDLALKIRESERRIRPHIKVTPLMQWRTLEGAPFLKLENEQYTGSFKARGSLNKIMSLSEEERLKGVITASTGNHGLGVARALNLTATDGTIYLPRSAKQAKVDKLREYGVNLKFVDGGPIQAELTAKKFAKKSGAVWISPYNDIDVIAGQGTIGVEILVQKPDISRAFITVGGGGLISGVATFLKSRNSQIEIIGCVPENSPEMMLSVKAGEIIHLDETLPTLSDGSAGGAEDDSITFEFCTRFVDKWVSVSEEEIAAAMKSLYDATGIMSEGSAGVAVAAQMKHATSGERDVIIICGGNIEDHDFFKAIG